MTNIKVFIETTSANVYMLEDYPIYFKGITLSDYSKINTKYYLKEQEKGRKFTFKVKSGTIKTLIRQIWAEEWK